MPAKGADMGTPAGPSVVVIGGGVIGLSLAWRAAQYGLAVTVADPDPGKGASYAAAGMITPVSEAAGLPTGYQQAGTLQVAWDSDDLAVLGEFRALQESFGVTVQPLTGRECRAAEPLIGPSVRGGLLAPDDASVDPRLLTSALLMAATGAGVRLIRSA